MATAAQQDEARVFLHKCRIVDVAVDGGLAYLTLVAPSSHAVQAIVPVRIVEIEWVDGDPWPAVKGRDAA